MALHSTNKRSDPKVVSGLLANEVLHRLANNQPEESRVFFDNFIRILEKYRYGSFIDLKPRGILDKRTDHKSRAESRNKNKSLDEIKNALNLAHQQVFNNKSKDEVVDYLKNVLKAVRDNQFDTVQIEDLDNTKDFIRIFCENVKHNI